MPFPASLTARIILGAVAVLAAGLLVWGVYHAITARPKAEAKVATNQTQAAQQNGADAVNTVGAAQDREAAENDLSRENERTIRNAEGANAPVAAPARDAGIAALCRRAAYAHDPRCVHK